MCESQKKSVEQVIVFSECFALVGGLVKNLECENRNNTVGDA